jgi:uncharacterized damage-inducible protein DinB
MEFSLQQSLEILERTPTILFSTLENLSEKWINSNEGENSWTAKEVVAHLIICERTNWMVRIKIILSSDPQQKIVPIDMSAHFDLSKNNLMHDLLKQFVLERNKSIKELKKLNLVDEDFKKHAIHPTLGQIYLDQLIATWVTHDLSHIAQIARILAKQNAKNVGAFSTFLKILK